MSKRKKILLVDDANTARLMVKMILRQSGFEIVTANDGVEAVAQVEKEQPDLVLMDVIMPRMNGFEAVKEIRAKNGFEDVPIIMVTTRGEEENVRRGFEHGCSDYLTKPINNVELLAKIYSFLGE